jgi:Family of unknown function (DUF5690)
MKTLKNYLSGSRTVLTIFAGIAAFFTYLCFYPFRRAYTAATYDGISFFGIDYKILLISAQVLGFATSKWLGIKYVSEMMPTQRPKNLMIMIACSWVCYFFFGLVPAPYNLTFMYLASLPLGMVYGVVLGFLEGRTITDLLVAILTASFILGSGFAKSIGSFSITYLGVSTFWMPFVASAIMFLPFAFSVWMLAQIPAPDATDQAQRTERKPMQKEDRKKFIQTFLVGIVLFTISYVLLTTFREFRDNFTPEIWKQLGRTDTQLFTQTELPIAIVVLLLMAAMRWIKNNYVAFVVIEGIMLAGGLLIGVATWLFQSEIISPFWWLTLVGMGGYFAYAMCNSLYFERMIATFKQPGTVGFLITFADYYAYLGSIFMLLYKNFFQSEVNYLHFFVHLSYVISFIYILLVFLSFFYFHEKRKKIAKV